MATTMFCRSDSDKESKVYMKSIYFVFVFVVAVVVVVVVVMV